MRRVLACLFVFVLAVSPASAAWSSSGTLGTPVQAKNTAGNTTLVFTTSAAAEAGNLVVCGVGMDNLDTSGSNGNFNDLTFSDSGSNNWVELEWSNGATAIQTTCTVALGLMRPGITLASSSSITATFRVPADSDAVALGCWEYAPGAGQWFSVEGQQQAADDAVDPSALTISGLTSREYVWLHALCAEGPNADAYTLDADYTAGPGTGTTGGAAATNVHFRIEWRIFTGTTDTADVTSTTADRDYAQLYLAVREHNAYLASGPFRLLWSGIRDAREWLLRSIT